MAFNPLEERGMPIEKQFRKWSDLNSKPWSKDKVHPYTRTRVILMNGIEVEGALFSHQFARHVTDLDLKRHLAMTRRLEQQQQKAVNWLLPAQESVLEVTIGYEQVAVDLTAFFARTESDPYIKAALDFGLLEDFDHLYRYANLMDLVEGKRAQEITRELTEVMPGRPTIAEHRHPFDDVRKHFNKDNADFLTQLHVLTIIAAEQQTMNFYMNVGNRPEQNLGRGLYLEIAQIEEQHVTHYESLLDPRLSWFEQLVLHEYNECWLYYSLMDDEPDKDIKKIWELHLMMEVEHLHIARDLMKQHEKRDPGDYLPKELPSLMKFQSNVDYVRDVITEQTHFNAQETEFLPSGKIDDDKRYREVQRMVNAGGAPSQEVVEKRIKEKGEDYRMELRGPHPLERFRDRKKTPPEH